MRIHIKMQREIVLVHNGIIENYREIRNGLNQAGIESVSETDSEVLVQLIASVSRGISRKLYPKRLKRLRVRMVSS